MAQTNVNIRMDEQTKKEFNAFCNEIGISVSSAFNIFAKTVVREHRIPFEITTDVPNSETIAAIEKADRGEDLYGPFDTVDEFMESLNA
ncbi:MAG: type II toxin-antitoxin system RelB/DinJ family antitoxin [Eubacterium sp.]|nr:type II toxin-antitoxin system RelB/DinJ family antitoxin [Eubacterium sp.]